MLREGRVMRPQATVSRKALGLVVVALAVGAWTCLSEVGREGAHRASGVGNGNADGSDAPLPRHVPRTYLHRDDPRHLLVGAKHNLKNASYLQQTVEGRNDVDPWATVAADACAERLRRHSVAQTLACKAQRRGADLDDLAWWVQVCGGANAHAAGGFIDVLHRRLFPPVDASNRTIGEQAQPSALLWAMDDVASTWWWTKASANCSAGRTAGGVASEVQRHSAYAKSPMCYYRLRNVCVVDGVLTLFSSGSGRSSVGGGAGRGGEAMRPLRLCNELRRKFHLHYAVEANFTFRQQQCDAHARTAQDRVEEPVAHVAACWQYYGFHLFHCLASLYTLQVQHRALDVDMYLYNHAASLPEASRDHFSHQLTMGNAASFVAATTETTAHRDGDTVRGATHRKRSNPYWLLWHQNTRHASRVRELRRGGPFPGSGPTRCYRRMLVGQPVHHTLTATQRRFHAAVLSAMLRKQLMAPGQTALHTELAERFLLTNEAIAAPRWTPMDAATPVGSSTRKALRVTVVHRGVGKMQGVRSIENLDAAMLALQAHLLATADAPAAAISVGSCISGKLSPSLLSIVSEAGLPSTAATLESVVLCLVDWAAMDIMAQFAVASASDITVAAHGGGNTWLAFQTPHQSVFVELWHAAYVPRNVFAAMAEVYGIRYLAHLRPDVPEPGNFMHRNVLVDVPQLLRLVTDGVQHVVARSECE